MKLLQRRLEQLNSVGGNTEDLVCISTNDVALSEIRNDLLTVKSEGEKMVEKSVKDRLGENPTASFRDKIPKVI